MAILGGTPGSMGIGRLGDADMSWKKKNRWEMQIQPLAGGNTTIPAYFIRLAARPNMTVEETTIDYLNERTWIPGKAFWETITVTIIDTATKDIAPLYSWLASVYDFTSTNRHMGRLNKDYAATALLNLYSGCGDVIETWIYHNVWPTNINFGDLDQGSSEMVEIELTLRYSQVVYSPLCPTFTITPQCTPCS